MLLTTWDLCSPRNADREEINKTLVSWKMGWGKEGGHLDVKRTCHGAVSCGICFSFWSMPRRKWLHQLKRFQSVPPAAPVYNMLTVGGYAACKGKTSLECLGCRDISQIFRGVLWKMGVFGPINLGNVVNCAHHYWRFFTIVYIRGQRILAVRRQAWSEISNIPKYILWKIWGYWVRTFQYLKCINKANVIW